MSRHKKKDSRFERGAAKVAIFGLEQFASVQDMVQFPLLQKKEGKLVHGTYHLANRVATNVGLQRKVYRRLKDKNTIELIE